MNDGSLMNLPDRRPQRSARWLLVALVWGVVAGCSRADSDKQAGSKDEAAAPAAKAGVTLEAETQARLGLKIESPVPAQWQAGIHATGRAANPLTFLAAATEYETARTVAAAAQAEWERTRKLAAQENASARALEAARAEAERDALALEAARARFTAEWGRRLAEQTNLTAVAGHLQAGDLALVKLFLPVGVFPDPPPPEATIYPFGDETNAVTAQWADNLNIDAGTQVQTLLYSVKQKLPPDIAVTAQLQMPGRAVAGFVVPVSAVVRYEGRGWVYVQTDTNQFVRAEVPLDRLSADGWFVSENLSTTNRIVVTGAQSVLSAELSSGRFTTGERD